MRYFGFRSQPVVLRTDLAQLSDRKNMPGNYQSSKSHASHVNPNFDNYQESRMFTTLVPVSRLKTAGRPPLNHLSSVVLLTKEDEPATLNPSPMLRPCYDLVTTSTSKMYNVHT